MRGWAHSRVDAGSVRLRLGERPQRPAGDAGGGQRQGVSMPGDVAQGRGSHSGIKPAHPERPSNNLRVEIAGSGLRVKPANLERPSNHLRVVIAGRGQAHGW